MISPIQGINILKHSPERGDTSQTIQKNKYISNQNSLLNLTYPERALNDLTEEFPPEQNHEINIELTDEGFSR